MKVMFASAAMSAILMGCATTAPSNAELRLASPLRPSALPAITSPAPAQVTIIRDTGFAGGGVQIHISVDSKRVASLKPGEYTMFDVDPGEHQISAIPTNTFGGHKAVVLEATWKPGQQVTYRAGFNGNAQMVFNRDAQAKPIGTPPLATPPAPK